MAAEFDIRAKIAFDFAKELCGRLGHNFNDARLARIAKCADSFIMAGRTAPPAFAEALELELLELLDDSGLPLPVAPKPFPTSES